MEKLKIVCKYPGALKIYQVLPKEAKQRGGYTVLNYKNHQKYFNVGKGDGQIQCEEIWERALETLEAYGESAQWKENLDEAENDPEKTAILRYQDFRKLIEETANRPISWVLETPYVGTIPQDVKTNAKEIQTKIRTAIAKLKETLQMQNVNGERYERYLILGLYAFVAAEDAETKLIGMEVENVPAEIKAIPELNSLLNT